MKARVTISNGKYVPQVKSHWWSSWAGLCKGSLNALLGAYQEFDTMEEAIKKIEDYKNQKINDGKVIWTKKYE